MIYWEQRKLGEIADIIGGGTPSTLNLDYWDGNIDWYSPAEIIDQIYVDRSQRKITELGFEKSSAKMLPEGTVLFTSRAGIGKTAILAKKGCTNQGFQSIVPHSNKLDSYFIFSRTEELKKYGELVGAGSTFVEVSGRQMENMQLMIPKTIDEQHIIGVLFSTFDHLITLHQSKSFGHILKAIVSCTLSWEQRKLGEVIQERNIRTSDFDKFPIFSLTIESGVTPKTERYERSSLVTKTEDLFKVVKPNEFVTNPMNLRFGALGYNTQKYDISVSGYYDVFSIDGNNCSGFWNAYFKTQQVMNVFDNVATGSLVEKKRVKYSTLKQIYVSVPSAIEEKNKISKFMSFTDHLITLHQSKLDKLQKIKKSMLESMFV